MHIAPHWALYSWDSFFAKSPKSLHHYPCACLAGHGKGLFCRGALAGHPACSTPLCSILTMECVILVVPHRPELGSALARLSQAQMVRGGATTAWRTTKIMYGMLCTCGWLFSISSVTAHAAHRQQAAFCCGHRTCKCGNREKATAAFRTALTLCEPKIAAGEQTFQ